MIPEFGHFALILALCLALVQSTVPLIGVARGNVTWMGMARSTAVGQFIFLGLAFACLAYAFVTNDFSVAYVAQNSNTHLPWLYRFCAVWGAHEGSILLWVFILSIWMALVSLYSRQLPRDTLARVLAVLGMISVGLLLFILFTSDPFARYLPSFPLQGSDLNPLLQDPGLIIHPPMLYMGYVGFAVPFAFSIAALMGGRLDAAWARWSRPWTQVAWAFLTLGIIIGSWWSYRELGWGGWWAWDPVENASFMPWLVGTALIHSLAATEKRNVFKAWTVLLAISTFALSLIGTFLVRSGVLISVHAFAVDATRGTFLLDLLGIVIGASLVLYAWRGSSIRGHSQFNLCSLETFVLTNNVLLSVIMLTVLLGTLYPLLIQALGLGKLSVGAPYFNSVIVPLMLPLLFLLGFGPIARWKSMQVSALFKKVRYSFLLSVILVLSTLWLTVGQINVLVAITTILALWVIMVSLSELKNWKRLSRTQYGKILAHVGVGICAIGIAVTSVYGIERDVVLKPNDSANIGPYQFTYISSKNMKGPNYRGTTVDVLVKKNNKQITILHSQKRTYTPSGMALSKAALSVNGIRDLYVALGKPLNANAWSMRIYYKPFIRYIWIGGLLMMLGALLAAIDKRYRRINKEITQ